MLTPFAIALFLTSLQTASPQPSTPAAVTPPASPVKPAPDGPVIAVETSMGTIEIGLYATRAPLSTRNIISYVKSGFYAGTVFHRVMPGFMIQGGGMDAAMNEKPASAPVRNEAKNGLLNSRGAVALARTNDPHSATSQFYISVKDNPALDFGVRDGWGYAVFGEVLSGMEVVDRIAGVQTSTRGGNRDVPVTPVVINKVRVVSEPAPPTPAPVVKPSPAASAKPAVRAPRPPPKVSPTGSPAAKPKPTP